MSMAQQDLAWVRWCRILIFFVSILMAGQTTRASALDDKIEAFKKAPDQTQTAVLEILKFEFVSTAVPKHLHLFRVG